MIKLQSKTQHNVIVFGIIVLVIVAAGFLVNNLTHLIAVKSEDTTASLVYSNAAPEDVLAVQNSSQPVVQINSYEYTGENENRYVSVNMTITNSSDSTLEFSPLLDLIANDDNNSSYNYTAQYTEGIVGGSILPNDSYTANYDFVIGGRDLISIDYTYDRTNNLSITTQVQ